MLKHEILEMKVAVRMDNDCRILSHREAEFHEKEEFSQIQTTKSVFEGSVNESNRGLKNNQENFGVHKLVGRQPRTNCDTRIGL